TIFLTTHYMDGAQYLADRVAVIAATTIVAEGPPGSLGGRDTAATIIRFRLPASGLDPPPIDGTRALGAAAYEVRTEDPTRTLYDLTSWVVERDLRLENLEVSRPTLEDVYLEL